MKIVLSCISGGHYVAYTKDEKTGKWHEYDDSIVTEVSEEKIQDVEAYVLFYKKRIPQRREEEMEQVKKFINHTVRELLEFIDVLSNYAISPSAILCNNEPYLQ